MEREKWVNIRGLAILCVVLIHITGAYLTHNFTLTSSFILLLNQASRFCVAVFFISSGFGLSYSQADKIGIIPYYKKRFKIVPPYIFWTVLYFFVTHFRGGMFGFSYGVITGNTYYHMYFIAVLIVVCVKFS